MSDVSADRNLLFGVLAWQNESINRDDLLSALRAWTFAKSRSLGELLVESGVITQPQRDGLNRLVDAQVDLHGGSESGWAGVVSEGIVASLHTVADSDVQASLRTVLGAESTPSGEATLPLPDRERASERFAILRPHSRGGLGEVFVARDRELDREVALKEVLMARAFDKDSQERFLLEARITGRLEHPGIVPVYGLGCYDDGRPYYAMRFIRGESLDAAIEDFHKSEGTTSQKNVEFRRLLSRFVDVCDAVAYAHSRGVLHRDLKPGNVMLGRFGETLVVDWGLAKVGASVAESDTLRETHPTDEKPLALSGESLIEPTMAGEAVGTPGYMSPEQAEGRLEDLGAASDVYSLGATLYHILTGQPTQEPGDPARAIARIIRGEVERPTVSNPDLPGPLEDVCLKAIALRPADRYASVRELADDVVHFLADEPVRASAERPLARVRRWIRKHPTLVVTTATLILLSEFGLAWFSVAIRAERDYAWQQQQIAKANEQTALTNEKIAQDQANLALESVQFVITDVNEGLRDVPQAGPMRKKLLIALAEKADQINQDFTKDGIKGQVVPTLMSIKMALATIMSELGETGLAGRHLDDLVELGRGRLHEKGRNDATRMNMARILARAAQVRSEISRNLEETIALKLEALDLIVDAIENPKQEGEGGPTWLDIRDTLANILQSIAVDHVTNGQLWRASEYFQRALTAHTDLLNRIRSQEGFEDLDEAEIFNQTAGRQLARDRTSLGLAYILLRLGETDRSLPLYEEAISGRREITDRYPFPRFLPLHAARSGFAGNFGNSYLWLDQPAKAEPLLIESLSLARKCVEVAPDNAVWKRDLAKAHYRMGTLRDVQGKAEEALAEFKQCRDLRHELHQKADTEKTRTALMLALARCGEADAAREIADALGEEESKDAERHLERARCYAQLSRHCPEETEKRAMLDRSLTALERSADEGYGDPFRVAAEHDLDPVHDEQRFRDVLKKLEAGIAERETSDSRP